jgi:hypothetical protein
MKDAGTGALVVIGILGVAVVAFLLTRDNKKSNHADYHYQYQPQRTEEPMMPVSPSERWEVKRGPDRLIEEIVAMGGSPLPSNSAFSRCQFMFSSSIGEAVIRH